MYYFQILIFAVLYLTLKGEEPSYPTECGTTLYKEPEKGLCQNKATVGQFPWMARIGLKDRWSGEMLFFCGGSLIHVRLVLTAAHCGERGTMVRLGEHDVTTAKDCDECDVCSAPHQDISIMGTVPAAHCRLSNVNDIELIVLSEAAKLNDFVQPICLPSATLKYSTVLNMTTVVSGWGAVYSGWGYINKTMFQFTRNTLMYVQTELLDSKHCSPEVYSRDLMENEMCVGYKQAKDPCIADSGSPMFAFVEVNTVKRATLIGVASHQLDHCAYRKRSPFSYTFVPLFRDFLIKELKSIPATFKTKL